MIETESQRSIREKCLNLLSRREYSQKELIDKLASKGFEASESQRVIDQFAENGWQSDQRYAESYCRYRIKKGYGPIKIGYELKQRGIENYNMDAVLFEIAENWIEILKQVYEKKFSDVAILNNKERLKRSRFLQQRGFSIEMINNLFKQLSI